MLTILSQRLLFKPEHNKVRLARWAAILLNLNLVRTLAIQIPLLLQPQPSPQLMA